MSKCDGIEDLSLYDDDNPNHLHYSCPICRENHEIDGSRVGEDEVGNSSTVVTENENEDESPKIFGKRRGRRRAVEVKQSGNASVTSTTPSTTPTLSTFTSPVSSGARRGGKRKRGTGRGETKGRRANDDDEEDYGIDGEDDGSGAYNGKADTGWGD